MTVGGKIEKPRAKISWESFLSEARGVQSTDSDKQIWVGGGRASQVKAGMRIACHSHRKKTYLEGIIGTWAVRNITRCCFLQIWFLLFKKKIVFIFKIYLETFAYARLDCIVWGWKHLASYRYELDQTGWAWVGVIVLRDELSWMGWVILDGVIRVVTGIWWNLWRWKYWDGMGQI